MLVDTKRVIEIRIEFLSEDNIAFSGFPLFQSPDPLGSRAQIWLVFIMVRSKREASFKTDRMTKPKWLPFFLPG